MAYREQAQERLTHLHTELKSGQEQLTRPEARTEELKQTRWRISGAIQVLEELEQQNPQST